MDRDFYDFLELRPTAEHLIFIDIANKVRDSDAAIVRQERMVELPHLWAAVELDTE